MTKRSHGIRSLQTPESGKDIRSLVSGSVPRPPTMPRPTGPPTGLCSHGSPLLPTYPCPLLPPSALLTGTHLAFQRLASALPSLRHLVWPIQPSLLLSSLSQGSTDSQHSVTVYLLFKSCMYLSFSPNLNSIFLGKIKFHPQPYLLCLTHIRCFQLVKINKNKNSLPK